MCVSFSARRHRSRCGGVLRCVRSVVVRRCGRFPRRSVRRGARRRGWAIHLTDLQLAVLVGVMLVASVASGLTLLYALERDRALAASMTHLVALVSARYGELGGVDAVNRYLDLTAGLHGAIGDRAPERFRTSGLQGPAALTSGAAFELAGAGAAYVCPASAPFYHDEDIYEWFECSGNTALSAEDGAELWPAPVPGEASAAAQTFAFRPVAAGAGPVRADAMVRRGRFLLVVVPDDPLGLCRRLAGEPFLGQLPADVGGFLVGPALVAVVDPDARSWFRDSAFTYLYGPPSQAASYGWVTERAHCDAFHDSMGGDFQEFVFVFRSR